MTDATETVANHYSQSALYDRILAALAEAGIERASLSVADLSDIDEFHIGGAPATTHLVEPLGLTSGARVLDIGCGIGGPARHIASAYDVSVTGIDLTKDFIDTARRLSADVGVDVDFVVGSALEMPLDDRSFDAATLIHVGMNLPDKPQLFSEVQRILRPGGVFAVYDVMLFGNQPEFPVPWATVPEGSFLSRPDDYLDAARAAGLTLKFREDRGEVARAFFEQRRKEVAGGGLPAVGLQLIMGDDTPQKFANMWQSINAGDLCPVEMVFEKPAT